MGTGRKAILGIIAVALIAAGGFNQKGMNEIRREVGLTRVDPLENAPPLLAFSTVALGGFRGLIANYLWMRANRLQLEGRYFEMVQLSDWITRLQPNFTQVWKHLAWNMAYNISRNFRSDRDRWLWVQSGIQLLRDQAIPLNPNQPVLYEELAWIFHDKMGKKIDDAHFYFKELWAREFNRHVMQYPSLDNLINPQTEAEKASAAYIREYHKLDPVFMKEVDEKYGPLDWRITDSHAIYWAALGLKRCPDKSIVLKRAIWQSMKAVLDRGRLIISPLSDTLEYGPNLWVADKVDKIMLELIEETPERAEYVRRAHRNFLEDATYYFYTHNRQEEAMEYYKRLAELYPDFVEKGVGLSDYVVARVVTFADLNPNRARLVVEGYLETFFYYTALMEDDLAQGNLAMATQIHQRYNEKVADRIQEIGLPTIRELSIQKASEIIRGEVPRFNENMILSLKSRMPDFAELAGEIEPADTEDPDPDSSGTGSRESDGTSAGVNPVPDP